MLPDELHQSGLVLREQRQILHQVEQARLVACAPDHQPQLQPARLASHSTCLHSMMMAVADHH